jgi:hypothetical protein
MAADSDREDGGHPPAGESGEKPRWSRPEITSFKPVSDAQGISYFIGDGISNLTPGLPKEESPPADRPH